MPFKIIVDTKKKEKPQVVVLCDVSDSVRNVSRFMLQFVYSIQDLYARVRSFIFVADLGDTRKLDLKKVPSISETLDWAKALTLLNVNRLEESVVNETLNTILKYEGDVRKAEAELKDYLQKQKAKAEQGGGQDDKDLLH